MKILPKPNIKVPATGKSDPWTASEIKAIFCNPLYIGHPLTEEQWVRQAAQLIKEDGREQFLINMLAAMRATGVLGEPPIIRDGFTPYGFSEGESDPFAGFGGN